MGLRMSADIHKWSEIISVTLVYIQETLDELISLQMNESNIRNYFTRMYFDVSKENETDETNALLEKINLFRENNRNVFVSTLDFLIAPLHNQIEVLNKIIEDPSPDAKKQLDNALHVEAISEMFVNKLCHDELEIITEYLDFKDKQLLAFKDEKLKLEKNQRKIDTKKIENLRNELNHIRF